MTYKQIFNQHFPDVVCTRESVHEEYFMADKKSVVNIIRELKNQSFNLILEFAVEGFDRYAGIIIMYVFEKKENSKLLIVQSKTDDSVDSISHIYPLAILFEREIQDGFGITINNLADNRQLFLHEFYPDNFHPLKKSFKNEHVKLKNKVMPSEEYHFHKIEGEGVYEIPVGPIHAGIIAPGHFRFNVIGETVLNLEIRHFWKHRGIEKIAEEKTPEQSVAYAESICGDETVANSLAYCIAIERISNIKIPKRAEHIRILYAELERIYSLLGDLAGMIVDVAYPKGASQFFNLREEILQWNEKLSGSRFYKGALIIGGVKKNVESEVIKKLHTYLDYFNNTFDKSYIRILENPSVIDRFETTGIISKKLVNSLNLTGPTARASGAYKDERTDHPYSDIYDAKVYLCKILNEGDVLARFKVKANTIKNSVNIIRTIIERIHANNSLTSNYNASSLINDGYSFSIVESSRGQNMFFVYIKNKKISRFKVRTASFCNWYAIEHAVMGNIVPDFPVINKSLNLSYEGNDL